MSRAVYTRVLFRPKLAALFPGRTGFIMGARSISSFRAIAATLRSANSSRVRCFDLKYNHLSAHNDIRIGRTCS